NGLAAATVLARGGSKVLLAEASGELGGAFREIEFAPGFRAAPLATDAGCIAPELLRATGLSPLAEEDPAEEAVTGLGSEGPLALHRDAARAAQALQKFSRRDAERWPAFCADVARMTGFVAQLYNREPPRIDASGPGEWLGLASLGLKFRQLGK